MADCREIAPLLGFFEDSELEPHEMQEVARHLAYCKGCETTLSDYATLGRRLRGAAAQPSLDNFALQVQCRLDRIPVSLRIRLGRHLEFLTERWTAGLALASAALALGAWVLLFAPYAQRYLERGQGAGGLATRQAPAAPVAHDAPEVVSADAPAAGVPAEEAPAEEARAQAVISREDVPQAVISRLEAKTQGVAVWSEPETRTTVIWLPDEP